MQKLVSLLLFLITQSVVAQQATNQWFKGNTHTHSYWSDGDDFPEMIMHWYKSHGYQFISLSDHNTLAEGEKWKQIPAHPFRQRRFNEYLEKYGKDWVTYKTDSTGLMEVKLKTFEEYAPLFEEKGKFLIMPAEEISDGYKGKPVHMNAINVKDVIQPKGGNSIAEVMQNNLDQVYAQRQRTGQPMFPHINHPNFEWAVKLEDMLELKGERFFEVYNGHPHVHNYGDSVTMGMEELWDKLQIHYIQQGKPLLYGLATDDAHNHLEYKISLSNPGRGWIMVKARELTASAIIESMEKGDFYASTGVELNQVSFSKNTLSVEVSPQEGVAYTIQFWGARKAGKAEADKRVLLKEIKGEKAMFKLTKKHLFVRAKVISSKFKENPYKEGDLETAWTQPVTIQPLTEMTLK
ncbi:histidinol-phosphatase [Rhodocytophaga aerolata]|uniref:Histidinol-phosphatase n=1 Tax=Rhodocytophaga aerolata TaxID=455078 RepID=A0ABT8R357_9BACT|nr:histidinol-phosphatase [Rhodocytophaga aerolata]MDO1446534.1 histidinol-phosphatase [Rhodocytophaga aerolata]